MSTSAGPVPSTELQGISADLSLSEIIRRLGPAARDVGSGVHVLQWDVTDGGLFQVSAINACDRPLATCMTTRGEGRETSPNARAPDQLQQHMRECR